MYKKIVPVVVVLLLLAGVGYYLKTKQSPSGVVGNQTNSQATSEASEFAKAMQSGKPTTCTLTKDGNTMEYNLKGKMMAINMTALVEGKTLLSHMINDGQYFYMWQDGQTQGSKMAIPSEEETKAMTDQAKQYQKNAPKFEGEADYQSFKDQGYTIKCAPANLGDSSFTPPSNINFVDPSSMMKQVTTPEGNVQIDMNKIKELQQKYNGSMGEDQ